MCVVHVMQPVQHIFTCGEKIWSSKHVCCACNAVCPTYLYLWCKYLEFKTGRSKTLPPLLPPPAFPLCIFLTPHSLRTGADHCCSVGVCPVLPALPPHSAPRHEASEHSAREGRHSQAVWLWFCSGHVHQHSGSHLYQGKGHTLVLLEACPPTLWFSPLSR